MTWIEIWQVLYKTIICYFFLILILKVMGKREVGKVSTFDIVVFFVISELFSLSLNDPKMSILHSLIPITIIVLLQLLSAYLSLKNQNVRRIMEGRVNFIIYKGEIQQDEMTRQRYNIQDLMTQIRTKDIQSPEEVEFGILEDNGTLNLITKKDCTMKDPEPLLTDGKVQKHTLVRLGVDEVWLKEQLKLQDIHDYKEVLLALSMNDGLYVVRRKRT